MNRGKHFIIILYAILTVVNLTACNYSTNESNIDNTKIHREVTLSNKEQLFDEAIRFIKGQETTIKINIDTSDIMEDATVNNYYFFNGSLYIQIDCYMYRFQIEDNIITSYIKYTLEA